MNCVLIYKNDLSENFVSSKLFADDTSHFSVVKNTDASDIGLKSDFKKARGMSIPMGNKRFFQGKTSQELGLATLQQRLWYRKVCCFYKILKSQSVKSFFSSIISIRNIPYRKNEAM